MISSLVLAISLLLLLNLGMVTLDNDDWTSRDTLAGQRLQEKFLQLRDAADSANGADTVDNIIRTWKVHRVDEHRRQITVEVLWKDVFGKLHTRSMSSLVVPDSLRPVNRRLRQPTHANETVTTR
ncbi:MAG: hypothetical protein D6800_10785 [Candidatus Zixiibacteriota bacterium]|nr:MAG: hypothetical protein D6800_10785 [candidate division Zixibacteria bacterium]